MPSRGRSIIALSVIAGCAGLPVLDSSAQGFPAKPIRLLVGLGAGGTDTVARLVAQRLAEPLGQTVIVENRPGAATVIATERVATSPPDGYTLLLMPPSTVVQSALRARLPYNIERDLAPISLVARGPLTLVIHPSVPARTVQQLIALARSQPGKLNYGSTGIGGAPHLAGELFNHMAKVNIVHVAYKGGGDAIIATTSGQIEMSFTSVAAALPLVDVGKLRPLALSIMKRATLMPSIPTLDEAGLPGYDYPLWYGVVAPAGVPKEIIAQLNAAIGKVVNSSEMKDALNRQGFEPEPTTPEQFAALIRSELAQNAKLIALAGMKPE